MKSAQIQPTRKQPTRETEKSRLISLLESTDHTLINTTIENEFLLRHPLYQKIFVNRTTGQNEVRNISLYHEVYSMNRQTVVAGKDIGYLYHLSDREDDCPKLNTFFMAYGAEAIRWVVEQMAIANMRVSTTNKMDLNQIKMAAPRIIRKCSKFDLDLNLAEVMYFFGNISEYVSKTKDSFTFGETQIIEALNVFKRDRSWQIEAYDRRLRNEEQAKQRELWRREGSTYDEWTKTEEGKAVVKELSDWGKQHGVNIPARMQEVTNSRNYPQNK